MREICISPEKHDQSHSEVSLPNSIATEIELTSDDFSRL